MGIRRIVHPIERAIDDIYSMGRRHPGGRSPAPIPRSVDGTFEPHALPTTHYETPDPTEQRPQDPVDQHGANYDNDHAQDWVRGFGNKMHPFFDSGREGRHKK